MGPVLGPTARVEVTISADLVAACQKWVIRVSKGELATKPSLSQGEQRHVLKIRKRKLLYPDSSHIRCSILEDSPSHYLTTLACLLTCLLLPPNPARATCNNSGSNGPKIPSPVCPSFLKLRSLIKGQLKLLTCPPLPTPNSAKSAGYPPYLIESTDAQDMQSSLAGVLTAPNVALKATSVPLKALPSNLIG